MVVTKYWKLIIAYLCLLVGWFIVLLAIFGGGNNGASADLTPGLPFSEIVEYKNMLRMYADAISTIENSNQCINSIAYLHDILPNMWAQTTEQYLSSTSQVNLYIKPKIYLVSHLSEEERLHSLNYIASIMAHQASFINPALNDPTALYGYFLESRNAIMRTYIRLLNEIVVPLNQAENHIVVEKDIPRSNIGRYFIAPLILGTAYAVYYAIKVIAVV